MLSTAPPPTAQLGEELAHQGERCDHVDVEQAQVDPGFQVDERRERARAERARVVDQQIGPAQSVGRLGEAPAVGGVSDIAGERDMPLGGKARHGSGQRDLVPGIADDHPTLSRQSFGKGVPQPLRGAADDCHRHARSSRSVPEPIVQVQVHLRSRGRAGKRGRPALRT